MKKKKMIVDESKYWSPLLLGEIHGNVYVRQRFLSYLTPTLPPPDFIPNPPYAAYRNR